MVTVQHPLRWAAEQEGCAALSALTPLCGVRTFAPREEFLPKSAVSGKNHPTLFAPAGANSARQRGVRNSFLCNTFSFKKKYYKESGCAVISTAQPMRFVVAAAEIALPPVSKGKEDKFGGKAACHGVISPIVRFCSGSPAIIPRFARDVKPDLQSGTKPDGLTVVRLRTKKKRGVKK